jgi:hypothetical protein
MLILLSLGPVLEGMACAKQYRLMCLNGIVISLNVGNDCVAKSDGTQHSVHRCTHACCRRNFEGVSLFFDYPLPPSSVNIYQCNHPTAKCPR